MRTQALALMHCPSVRTYMVTQSDKDWDVAERPKELILCGLSENVQHLYA